MIYICLIKIRSPEKMTNVHSYFVHSHIRTNGQKIYNKTYDCLNCAAYNNDFQTAHINVIIKLRQRFSFKDTNNINVNDKETRYTYMAKVFNGTMNAYSKAIIDTTIIELARGGRRGRESGGVRKRGE